MLRGWMAKVALGFAGACTGGMLAGMALANYVASGSFDFYRQSHVAEWRPDPASDGFATREFGSISNEHPDLLAASYDR
ncbi:hypothetical protein [Sphingomonas sp. M1-B02]|uniref:hypothetical protein n=1 Tax=Sphingomonas sp. M1-B02 TaxID=3114300 RepID=UPI0022406C32|nr:hypothetical protein [Sphingomonas sp. S6-11]UZK67154.1 hypothetical protein OKW87_04805 [Sphingomonas sp. S6-11]